MSLEVLNARLQQTLPRGRVCVAQPAGCPTIHLHLFDPGVLEGPLSHDEAQAVVADPAYWSFCWASGQALAQFILVNPDCVAGKRVIDVGCGSGVVAIAAALAGARKVIACDMDPAALDAAQANACLNQVTLTTCRDWHQYLGELDVIMAADVLYDPENLSLLASFCEAVDEVLLADSRVRDLGDERYQLKTTVEGRTWPDLNEFEEFNQVRIYRVGAKEPGNFRQ